MQVKNLATGSGKYGYLNKNGSLVTWSTYKSSDAGIKTEVTALAGYASSVGRISLHELKAYEFVGTGTESTYW